jgi:hypothetical protein
MRGLVTVARVTFYNVTMDRCGFLPSTMRNTCQTPGDPTGGGSVPVGSPCRIERAAPRPRRVRAVDTMAAREGLMREHEAGRPRTPRRWHPWIKRISNVAAHVSAASLLASGLASSLAARKHKNRHDDRGGSDQTDRDRDGGGNDRNREDRDANDPKEDRGSQRENRDRSHGDSDGGSGHRGGKQESQVDGSSDVHSAASKQAATATPTPTPTSTPTGDGGGGGGKGDGGGNDAGNAGSGFFDSPLATKARRRANDFDNANPDEDDGIIVDVDPEGESVYETDSILFVTGPEGVEILTSNISYFAEPTPTPEPLPGLELPVREPGFPFGEDFPFGDTIVAVAPTTPEPPDPGDTGTALTPRAKPIVDSNLPEPISSDGGDNSVDFLS